MVILERNGTVARDTHHRTTLRIVLQRSIQWLRRVNSPSKISSTARPHGGRAVLCSDPPAA